MFPLASVRGERPATADRVGAGAYGAALRAPSTSVVADVFFSWWFRSWVAVLVESEVVSVSSHSMLVAGGLPCAGRGSCLGSTLRSGCG